MNTIADKSNLAGLSLVLLLRSSGCSAAPATVQVYLANRGIHSRWLLIHEGHRLPLLVFALLFSTQVAQCLDVLLLSFKLLLQPALSAVACIHMGLQTCSLGKVSKTSMT